LWQLEAIVSRLQQVAHLYDHAMGRSGVLQRSVWAECLYTLHLRRVHGAVTMSAEAVAAAMTSPAAANDSGNHERTRRNIAIARH
jgi:hypothetical protein